MKSLWTRKSAIISVPEEHLWWKSSAQVPFVHQHSPQDWQIFFAARDKQNRSRTLSLHVNPKHDMSILEFDDTPILSPRAGDFPDRDGIALSALVRTTDCLYGYTTDFSRGEGEYYNSTIGLFRSFDDARKFSRVDEEVMFEQNSLSSFAVSTPCVVFNDDAIHMWFAKHVKWDFDAEGTPNLEHYYDIWHACSDDGLNWNIDDTPTIPLQFRECGMSRPWVMPSTDGRFEMWFCVRGARHKDDVSERTYSIGYAVSDDLLTWHRMDHEHGYSNPPVPGDWDFEMQCYPSVTEDENGNQYMFYCGNDFARKAFGYAVREK